MSQYIAQCSDTPVINNGVVSCTGSMTIDPVLTSTDINSLSTQILVIVVLAWSWRAIGSLIYKIRG
jgi:hypothetical protein